MFVQVLIIDLSKDWSVINCSHLFDENLIVASVNPFKILSDRTETQALKDLADQC